MGHLDLAVGEASGDWILRGIEVEILSEDVATLGNRLAVVLRTTGMAMVKLIALFLLAMMGGVMVGMEFGQGTGMIDLDTYTWKNRLLMIFSPSEEYPRYRDLTRELRDQHDEIIDRDLLIFRILERGESRLGDSPIDEASADLLRDRLSARAGQFLVVLIGKDGGEKLRQSDEVELEEIFSLIDSMPMRQRERSQRKSQ